MTIDFQRVRAQVQELGLKARKRAQEIRMQREQAFGLLDTFARETDYLMQRVERITRQYDPNLRCAVPALGLDQPPEALNHCAPLAALPAQATLIAADGSQINPDRHAQASYGLINVGAITARLGELAAPQVSIFSQLLYDEELFTPNGVLSEAQVALRRDLNERKWLAKLAEGAPPPVITFTDGPMELWGGQEAQERAEFAASLHAYHEALRALRALGVTTAGYVDKPSANLVVRLLEIAALEEHELSRVKEMRLLSRASDRELFQRLLGPGERSAVFAIQSRSAGQYPAELALHFFYLNVSGTTYPWLARVEIPAWVAAEQDRLETLQAVLYHQCQIMGNRPYPYLIHRAHEAAVVSLPEKQQVDQMVVAELYRQGVAVDQVSYKQAAKDLPLRTRYER